MTSQLLFGLTFAVLGCLVAASSWTGRGFLVDSTKDDHLVLWIGEEGARMLDVALALFLVWCGVTIAIG